MVDQIMALPERTKIQLLAPVVRGRKGRHEKVLEQAKRSGYVRVMIDGSQYELSEEITLDKNLKHNISIIESAYKALKVAPGLRRNFAAEQWSQIPETAWRNARAEAMDAIDRQGAFKAFGFDVDDMAVELTRNNAKKAGVGSKLTVKQQDISKYSQIEGSITIVNPPYGERMLEIKEAEELYKKMGQRLCPSKENPI